MRAGALALLAAALVLRPSPGLAQKAADPQPVAAAAEKPADKPASAASKLAEARAKAAAAGAGLASTLGSLAEALPPEDSLALIAEFLPGLAAPEDRTRYAIQAGDLALLLGRYADSARRYEEASALPSGGRDPVLAVRAARSWLAAGEAEKATDLAALALMSAQGPGQSARARLVGAWALAMRGRSSEAKAMAEDIAGPGRVDPSAEIGADTRREARFLVWALSSPESRKDAAAALAKEYPGSAEALVASGSAALPPMPHWYLGALALSGALPAKPAPTVPAPATPAPAASAPAASASAAPAPPALAPPAADASATAAVARRFQVGYYAREENATSMRDALAAKGFTALIEPRPQMKPKAGDDGRRWAVVVEGGADPARTRDRLKDAGFESYPIF